VGEWRKNLLKSMIISTFLSIWSRGRGWV